MLHILLLLVKGGDELVTLSTADNIITVTGNRYNKTGSTNIIITASKLGYQDNIITIPLQVRESLYKFTCLNCGWSSNAYDSYTTATNPAKTFTNPGIVLYRTTGYNPTRAWMNNGCEKCRTVWFELYATGNSPVISYNRNKNMHIVNY